MAKSRQEEVTTETPSLEPVFDGTRLIFAGRDCYLIPEELYSYASTTKSLDLTFNCIKDLVGIEKFSVTLEELILDNNEITENTSFPLLSNLQLLSLCNNKISDLYQFIDEVENKLPKLAYLSLLGNKACPDSLTQSDCDESDYERYRKYVVYKFPHLKFLDSKPVTAKEKKEAKRTGKYLRVVKPASVESEDENASYGESARRPLDYKPLPDDSPLTFRGNPPAAGTFKKAKYVYHGKHSEGNRFIRNNDL